MSSSNIGRRLCSMYALIYCPVWSSLLLLVAALPIFTLQHLDDDTVRVPPLIVNEPPSSVVFPAQRDDVVELRCESHGSPSPSIRWRRRDGSAVDESYVQSDDSLRVPADVSSDGFYQCLAENDAGTAMSNYTAVRAVEAPPDDEDRQLTVTVGDSVTLHCPVYQPSVHVHITWLYADTYRTPVPVDQTRAISDNGSLVITWAEITDGKKYLCRAEFSTSTKTLYSRPYELVVNQRSDHPTFSGKWLAGTTSVTSLEGDDVTLSCIFSGRVNRTVWERADKRPLRSGAWNLSDFGRRLTIYDVRPSDSGFYTCTAHYESRVNAYNSDEPTTTMHAHQTTVTVELRVSGAKPRLVRPLISRNISESQLDEPVTFHCEPVTSGDFSSSSSNNPSSSVTWYINAQPLTHDGSSWWQISADRSQLTLDRPRSCVVSCNVSNQHGSVVSSARLTLLPHGYVETPEVTETTTQTYTQQPSSGDDDAAVESFSHVTIVVMSLLLSSTVVVAVVALAAVLFMWKRHRRMLATAKKEETDKAAAAAADQSHQERDEDDDVVDADAADDDDSKSRSSLHSSLLSASQDSGINFTAADDPEADATVAQPTSDEDDVEASDNLLDGDDAMATSRVRPRSAS